ncbi:MAG TPA: aminotransferase class I/II-fold pyridoxal phosphate-dependent enzyme, partial [Gemmataceae bacterium]
LSGSGDAVFSDELNHASLIDGCRLGRGAVHVYRHADVGHLEALLRQHAGSARRRVIVSDTVFSMDGDLAPLAELVRLAERFDALLVIDEAHATGVLGERGTGLTELLAPEECGDPDRLVKVGTLSKALGCQGGFVCGTRRLVRWLVNAARPYIFSTAMSPPVAAAARAAVRIAAAAAGQRRHLARLREVLQQHLAGLDYPAARSTSPILPIVVGEPGEAVRLSAKLRERGLLVPAIRPPTVPPGTARLRVSLTAGHTEDDVRRLAEALRDAR